MRIALGARPARGQRLSASAANFGDYEKAGVELFTVAELYGFDAVSRLGYLAARTTRAHTRMLKVHPLSEVRSRLSGILARFRREGATAESVAFGSHRKPEAILIPYQAFERYEELARQRARLEDALSAAQSMQVELLGPFSPEHDRKVSANVDGQISAAELYGRTVSRYRQA